MAYKFNALTGKFDLIGSSTSGISNVVEDTTPQLGGDLDGQSTYDLNNIVNADIEGFADFTEIVDPANPASNVLRLWAKDTGGFGQLHFKNSNGLDYQLGRDNIHTVVNNTGVTLALGSVVYITGSNGTYPTVALAKADSPTTMPAAGILVAAIANGANGQMMTMGDIHDINTSAFTDGDILYVSPVTAGLVTTTVPTGTNIVQRVAVIIDAHVTAGSGAVLIGGEFDPTLTQTFTNKTLTSPKINEDVVLTPTSTELNYVDGVTSAIQTQLNAKASLALDNLASVAINTSLISDTDSTDDLGSSSKYWANGYVDKIYLNSTAYLDGGTAGLINTQAGFKQLIPNGRNQIALDIEQLDTTNSPMLAKFRNSGTGEAFRFEQNGTMGGGKTAFAIYTNQPHSSGDSYIFKMENLSTSTTIPSFLIKHNGASDAFQVINAANSSNPTYGIRVYVTNAGAGAAYGAIFESGNVGIGNVAPTEILDVTGNINATGVIKIDDVQVVSNRVVDSRCDDTPNSGDATTDGIIAAIQAALISHGLIAAA